MPQNITDVDTFTAPVVAPADGDTENAASVLVGLQALSNRTRYLLNNMLQGRATVPLYATIAALRAAGAPTAGGGAECAVQGYGFFVYNATSSGTDDGNFTVQPTGVSGAGRWQSLSATLNVANGIPQLDSAGRVPAAKVRNGIISSGTVTVGSFVVTSTSGSIITGCEIDFTTQVGDVIFVWLSAELDTANNFAFIAVADNSGTPAALGGDIGSGTAAVSAACNAVWTVATAGITRVAGEAFFNTGGTAGHVTSSTLNAIQIRP